MEFKSLAKSSLKVSSMGLGCMGMSDFYGSSDDKESIEALVYALDKGINFLDTADTYGLGHNEELISKAVNEWKGDRESLVIATKFGIVREKGSYVRGINGKPDYVKAACEKSLKNLNSDYIDLYYQHRIDVTVPIEETVGAMSELVKEGKVKYIGLSEASAESLKRANKVHPITALQSEYSLWTRDLESEMFSVLNELDISLVAYSPLGRGFLTGNFKGTNQLEDSDFRKLSPRFQEDNLKENLKLLNEFEAMAKDKNITPGQLALAWIYSKGDFIIPIPGTRKKIRLDENLKALDVKLSDSEIEQLESWFAPNKVAGARYPEAGMAGVNK